MGNGSQSEIVLLGATGNLSKAIQSIENQVQVIASREFLDIQDIVNSILNLKTKLVELSSQKLIVINTIGLVNPNANPEKLRFLNYEFPVRLYQLSEELQFRLVTLGTVYEKRISKTAVNNYLNSKNLFYTWLNAQVNEFNNLHLEFHSWYGTNKDHKHMFLSDLFSAISESRTLLLRNPNLTREFHHVLDDALVTLELSKGFKRGVVSVDSGDVVSLRDVAIQVLAFFGKSHLLAEEFHENLEELQTPGKIKKIEDFNFRPTISGIIESFEKKLKESKR